jgi:hypothetical protein
MSPRSNSRAHSAKFIESLAARPPAVSAAVAFSDCIGLAGVVDSHQPGYPGIFNSISRRKLVKRLLTAGVFVLTFASLAAWAQSSIDGTWKVDLSSAKMPAKPSVYLLQNGTYQCKSCTPPISVKADGADQKLTGDPYSNTLAVTVVNDHEIKEVFKKDDKVTVTSHRVVSADGKTEDYTSDDNTNPSGGTIHAHFIYARVAPGPAGSNAISGSWRITNISDISDNGLTFTFRTAGDMLSYANKTGQSYSVKLDGTEGPYSGDPGTTSVSVKRVDKNTLVETDKRNGKPITVTRIVVSPDGKTARFTVNDQLQNTTTTFVAQKQ